MLTTGNFPYFFGKNLVPRKWHLGTWTSTIFQLELEGLSYFLCGGQKKVAQNKLAEKKIHKKFGRQKCVLKKI